MVKWLGLWAHHGGRVQQFVSAPLFLHRSQPSKIKRTHHKAEGQSTCELKINKVAHTVAIVSWLNISVN